MGIESYCNLFGWEIFPKWSFNLSERCKKSCFDQSISTLWCHFLSTIEISCCKYANLNHFLLSDYYQFRSIRQQPAWYFGQTFITDEARTKVFESVDLLNTFLQGKKYITGSDEPTLADISLFSTVVNLFVCLMTDQWSLGFINFNEFLIFIGLATWRWFEQISKHCSMVWKMQKNAWKWREYTRC